MAAGAYLDRKMPGPAAELLTAAHAGEIPLGSQSSGWLDPVTPELGQPPVRGEGADRPVLAEPLTPKELEVLGLLATLLTTDEIADKLFISANTVRTHIASILRKLGVNGRNAAIRRARELGILQRGAPIVRPG